MYGTGKIKDIIETLLKENKAKKVSDLPEKIKINALCNVLQLSTSEFDDLIFNNSPVMRTVKGHVFETYFDDLIKKMGANSEEVGGDSGIDRIVNNNTLQLKTYTVAGTNGEKVQYKTHKTHGAKSEQESFDYYHTLDEFADYLVGLVSYNPFKVLILNKDELPTHPKSPTHILSPFTLNFDNHPALNAFHRLGIQYENNIAGLGDGENEILPKTANFLGVSSDVIANTLLKEENFRIWDMAIRGFAREVAFVKMLKTKGISDVPVSSVRSERADKADHALQVKNKNEFCFFQMKGLSVNNCTFDGAESIVGTETQLTRGRVNDHPTQSRLYLVTDFDYLVIGLDPCLGLKYRDELGLTPKELIWEFYSIPTQDLSNHHEIRHRLKSLQKFKYIDLQKYKINEQWLEIWHKN